MHRLLRKQIREAIADSPQGGGLDRDSLFNSISSYYDRIDEERRGTVRAMQLMSEEALALNQEVKQQSETRVQAIVDNVKDAIITVDETGDIESLNPTGERIFDYHEDEVLGQPLSLLIPAAGQDSIRKYLDQMASRKENTFVDLAPHEAVGRRNDGEVFAADVTVSKTTVNHSKVYIVCLRDATERKEAERALRESEARYRTLVENAPEAIVVFDLDAGRFVEVNENAERFFRMERKDLLQVGPEEVSPPQQSAGTFSFGIARGFIASALAGETPVFEWVHRDAEGRDIPCEVRLVRLPSSTRKLVRGSITDITDRKRAELLAAGEREVLECMAANAPLEETMTALVGTVESVSPESICAVQLLDEADGRLVHVAAPRLPEAYRRAMDGTAIGPSAGSCGACVALGEPVIVSDIQSDARWEDYREIALSQDLRAGWAAPIKLGDGRVVGAFAEYFRSPRSPGGSDFLLLERVVRLAGIATERKHAEEALRSSEARFRGLFENVIDGVYQSSVNGEIISANPALVRMLGYESAEDLCGRCQAADLYANPQDREVLVAMLHDQGEVRNHEYRLKRKDGQQIVVLENSHVVHDDQGKVIGYEGTISDITERKKAEMEVFEAKERAQVTLQSIGDAVITTDALGRIEYLNPVAEDLTGWEIRAVHGRPVEEVIELIHDTTREPVENPVTRSLREGRVMGLKESTVLVNRHGNEIAIQDSVAPIRDRSGNIVGTVMVFHDVSKERRLRRALSYQASHDALTGLINRREFENRLADALSLVRNNDGCRHVLLYLDLDQFKVVNDTCGHTAGDQLLKQVTALLQSRVRVADIVARLGGDEFGILLEGCSVREALKIADSIRQAVREFRFLWQDGAMNVGVSIGVVEIANDTDSVASVLSAADVACYAAKDLGRNRVHVYQHGEAPQRHREMQWISRLTRACEEGRLDLYFQPIVPIGENKDRQGHFELLLRMRDENGVVVQPEVFIPAAERYNLMPTIDRWVVHQCFSSLAHRREGGRGGGVYTLAINLSGTSLNDEKFLRYVIDEWQRYKLSPGAICFEITETAAVSNLHHVAYFMRELKRLGCRFSLDDFGSGLSSFTYLKTLPVDFLKIDGQFVQNVAADRVDLSIVEAISQVGRAMGIKAIAERVETPEVLSKLADIGVEYGQGFYIAAPEPVARFPRFANQGAVPNLRLA